MDAKTLVAAFMRERGLTTWTITEASTGPLVSFRNGRKTAVINAPMLALCTPEAVVQATKDAYRLGAHGEWVAVCPGCKKEYYRTMEPRSSCRYFCQADNSELLYV